MKIIFLDLDGVLNNQVMFEKSEDDIIKVKYGSVLSKTCVGLLNHITDETKAKLVISSTWRMDEDINDQLISAGITGEIIGQTPILRDKWTLRGNEIHAWVVENQALHGKYYYDFHSYAILDDDSDMLYWQKANFFQTDAYAGLTPNLADKIIKFLNRYD